MLSSSASSHQNDDAIPILDPVTVLFFAPVVILCLGIAYNGIKSFCLRLARRSAHQPQNPISPSPAEVELMDFFQSFETDESNVSFNPQLR